MVVQEITTLKEQVSQASFAFDSATRDVAMSRRRLEESLLEYETVSSRHTSLLQKRDEWSAEDATSFATLVNKEVEARQELDDARKTLRQQEQSLSECQLSYINALRKRYHEEQIWQDKWRIIGTYGTWSLIVLNSIVFLASQYIHQLRESRRIQAIAALINEKIPDALISEKELVAASIEKVKEKSNNNQEVHGDRVNSCPANQDELVVEEVVSESAESQTTDAKESKEYGNGSELGSRRNWRQLLSKAALAVGSQGQRTWNDTKQTISDVHLPSAALGASVATTALLIAITLSGATRNQR